MTVSKGEEEEKAAIGDEMVCVNIQVQRCSFYTAVNQTTTW